MFGTSLAINFGIARWGFPPVRRGVLAAIALPTPSVFPDTIRCLRINTTDRTTHTAARAFRYFGKVFALLRCVFKQTAVKVSHHAKRRLRVNSISGGTNTSTRAFWYCGGNFTLVGRVVAPPILNARHGTKHRLRVDAIVRAAYASTRAFQYVSCRFSLGRRVVTTPTGEFFYRTKCRFGIDAIVGATNATTWASRRHDSTFALAERLARHWTGPHNVPSTVFVADRWHLVPFHLQGVCEQSKLPNWWWFVGFLQTDASGTRLFGFLVSCERCERWGRQGRLSFGGISHPLWSRARQNPLKQKFRSIPQFKKGFN
jgi:hypothetical protein